MDAENYKTIMISNRAQAEGSSPQIIINSKSNHKINIFVNNISQPPPAKAMLSPDRASLQREEHRRLNSPHKLLSAKLASLAMPIHKTTGVQQARQANKETDKTCKGNPESRNSLALDYLLEADDVDAIEDRLRSNGLAVTKVLHY